MKKFKLFLEEGFWDRMDRIHKPRRPEGYRIKMMKFPFSDYEGNPDGKERAAHRAAVDYAAAFGHGYDEIKEY